MRPLFWSITVLGAFGLALLAGATENAATQSFPLRKIQGGNGRPEFGGVYPHLATFNQQNECGTGAVVEWAGKLWWITYAPHRPNGSDDGLYAIDSSRDLWRYEGSVGGTPANRMIHRESDQLLIGPYVIARDGSVRVIPPEAMPGRLTGTARHLSDPAGRVYYGTMEEGFYEVDVKTLEVEELHPDANRLDDRGGSLLPGYHGKGLYTGQGRLVYANNGETGRLAQSRPDIPSGVLAEWLPTDVFADGWRVVERNQFTEVTGPGGIHGNKDPKADPVWSVGWDHRSLMLMLLEGGKWHRYRLPKASHCYDGAHGWNTEWPRIRDVGEGDLLMTMHGAFWRFPRGFRQGDVGGIRQRSSYLKVIGDFTRYGDRLVFGCDDAARAEFLNTRKAKGELAGPEESQSNLWFVKPEALDGLGPMIGRGAVWLDDSIEAGLPSDPFATGGFDECGLHLTHDSDRPVTFVLESDREGTGSWERIDSVVVPESGYRWHRLDTLAAGEWVRLRSSLRCRATAWFECRGKDLRDSAPSSIFAGLATTQAGETRGVTLPAAPLRGGLLRAGSRDRGLQLLSTDLSVGPGGRGIGTDNPYVGYYELTPGLELNRADGDSSKQKWMIERVSLPEKTLSLEGSSILYVDDDGSRFRLPVSNPIYRSSPGLLDALRTAREAVTERDLFQCAGTFFELPARNAGGFRKVRPIASHDYFVQDYASWRGLLVLTGIADVALGNEPADIGRVGNSRIIRSKDGGASVWLGTIDDLWGLGKPRGSGGPWFEQPVEAGVPSDPYLMAGYDRKELEIEQESVAEVMVHVEVDISGTGNWHRFTTLAVLPGEPVRYAFPEAFHAYWVRLIASAECQATATLHYE